TMQADMTDLRAYISEHPDFPRPGILFRDISPLLREQLPATLGALEALLSPGEWSGIDTIGVIDARGFVLGAGLAARLGKGVVMIRKAGKLPPPVHRLAYGLEYGSATLEVRSGTGRLLLVDDVLATGGTLRAAASLVVAAGFELAGAIVLADLGLVSGLDIAGRPVSAVLHY
ncbi:MAG: adenine phosphoribosyltransferase, partial [Steroidobacteraceae bacterium]